MTKARSAISRGVAFRPYSSATCHLSPEVCWGSNLHERYDHLHLLMATDQYLDWEDLLARQTLPDGSQRLSRPPTRHLRKDQSARGGRRVSERLETIDEHQLENCAEDSAQETETGRFVEDGVPDCSPPKPGRRGRIFHHAKQRLRPASLLERRETLPVDSVEETKTRIGPWVLGDELGRGATGCVRLCRHRVTQQIAAVKILCKDSAKLVQAASIINIDNQDRYLPEDISKERRIPVSIEREVAILKLIQHPNITRLYDIWENRRQM